VRKPHPLGGRASVTERGILVGQGIKGLSDAANLLAAGLEPILFESREQEDRMSDETLNQTMVRDSLQV
jgi:hypothetical protein